MVTALFKPAMLVRRAVFMGMRQLLLKVTTSGGFYSTMFLSHAITEWWRKWFRLWLRHCICYKTYRAYAY